MKFYRSRTKHKLNVGNEVGLTKAMKLRKARSGFSPITKFVGTFIALSIALTTAVVGVTIMPTPGKETASADWLTDLICSNNNSVNGIYGGTASSLGAASGRTPEKINEDTSQPWKGMLAVPVPEELENLTAAQGTRSLTVEMTALERYGFFNPTFESWKGLALTAPDNSDNPVKSEGGQIFFGSGGTSTLTEVGPGVIVKDLGQNAMFSENGIMCIGAAFASGEAGNTIMFFPKLAIAIASILYFLASDLSLSGNSMLAPIGDVIETMILGDGTNQGLKDLLFLDFMLVMVMLGAIVVAWQGLLKGRMLEALQSVGWMLLVGITGILFLSNPLWLSNTMEKGLDIIETAVESATLQTSNMSPECSLPNSYDKATEREVMCSLWLNSIYKPWVNGQFGKDYNEMIAKSDVAVPDPSTGFWTVPLPSDKRSDAVDWFGNVKNSADNDNPRGIALKASIEGSSLAGAESRGVFAKFVEQKPLGTKNVDSPEFKNWAFYHMHSQSNWDAATGVNTSEVAFNQLAIEGNTSWKLAMDAVPNSFLSFIASAAPAIFMIVIAGTLISFQIILVVLIVLAPFFFTLGFFPGWGRRILMRWLEMIASLFVKRVILVLFLFIFLKIYISILDLDISWTFQVLFITLLTIVALTQKDQITQMVTSQINFGSYNNFGSEESMKGAAVAGVLGGYYVAKKGTRMAGGLASKFRRGGKPDKNTNKDNGKDKDTFKRTDEAEKTQEEANSRGGNNNGGGGTPQPNTGSGGGTPNPGGGAGGKTKGGSGGPDDWKWDWENRDKDGKLIGATRYNADGSGKAYHNGESYTVMRGPNGSRYAIKDSDGSKLEPQTLAHLGEKRNNNASYASLESKQKQIETLAPNSAGYVESRAERAALRDAEREVTRVAQQQAAIEASKDIDTGVIVTGPHRSDSSTVTRRSSSTTVAYVYDPSEGVYSPAPEEE